MRAVFLTGGFVGFLVVAVTGWAAGRAGDRVLFDASLGCLAGAFLFRWFWERMISALTQAIRAKRAARQAAEEAQAAAKAVPVTAIRAK